MAGAEASSSCIHVQILQRLFGTLAQVEKFRPKNIDDVVGNVEAVSRLQVIGREGNFPNVILAVSSWLLN